MTRTREQISPSGVSSDGADRLERDAPELLARIRRGDADAFEQVAREVSPRLYRLALHLSGNRDDAEDLVQETLVRALPALRKFEGRARLSTYLVRALGNLWKNRLRSRSRSRIVSSAAACCSSVWWKITDRYCVPTSAPCRLSVVGSWMEKKISVIFMSSMLVRV